MGHLERLEEAKGILSDSLKLRTEIKNVSDYEKVAPTIIREVLIKVLVKSGMTNI